MNKQMYALQREDGMTWGEYNKEQAEELAAQYRATGASDRAVPIQPHWTKIRKFVPGEVVYWNKTVKA